MADSTISLHRLEVDASTVVPVEVCSCCGGSAGWVREETAHAISHAFGRESRTPVTLPIPLCEVCAAHATVQRARRLRATGFGLIAAVGTVAVVWWILVSLYRGQVVPLLLVGAGGVALGLGLARVLPHVIFRAVLRSPGESLQTTGTCTVPAQLQDWVLSASLACANETFLSAVRERNDGLEERSAESIALIRTPRGDLDVPRLRL